MPYTINKINRHGGIWLNKILLIATLLSLFLFTAAGASAQSNNSDACSNGSSAQGDNKFIGVCNLQNTVNGTLNSPFLYDDNYSVQGNIGFSIRSCGRGGFLQTGCVEPVAYRVEVQDSMGDLENFILTEQGSGGTIPITLAFSHPNSGVQQLSPNQPANQPVTGSVNQTNLSLVVALDSVDPTLLPGTYTGDFYFTLVQEQHCKFILIVTVCTDTYLTPIPFTVSITVEKQIRISGLSDMPLDANPTGITEGQQTFCVFSQGGAPFRLTANSDTANGSFRLAGSPDQIEYETWVDHLSTGNQEQLTEGQPTTQTWQGRLYEDCSVGGENMRITIRIQPTALGDAISTSYSDTLTLTVELE